MTIVTTEVHYDFRGMVNRLKRRNDKDSLCSELAKVVLWSMDNPNKPLPEEMLSTLVDRVLWGPRLR